MSIAVRISGGGLKQGIHRGMSMNGQCLINESQDRRRWNSFQESNVCRTDSRILDCSRGSQRSYTKIHSTIDPAIGDEATDPPRISYHPKRNWSLWLSRKQTLTNFDQNVWNFLWLLLSSFGGGAMWITLVRLDVYIFKLKLF